MSLTLHYDNLQGFEQPVVLVRTQKGTETIAAAKQDAQGATFEIKGQSKHLMVKFSDAANEERSEGDHLWRYVAGRGKTIFHKLWFRSWTPFVYTSQPQGVEEQSAQDCAGSYEYKHELYISESGGRVALGANLLSQKGATFGFFHPHAARVYLVGDFNNWQHPTVENANPRKFIPMTLHRGYFDSPNVWLAKVDEAQVGHGYKFYVEYGSLADEQPMDGMLTTDPYARVFGESYERNDAVIVDPTTFKWQDSAFKTPAIHDLIIYQLHPHGFTWESPDIAPEHQGKYAGIVDRIQAGYFDRLGVTALYLMPLAEVPTPQPGLGYNTSVFHALERDFGTPDDLRNMVNEAHKANLAVIVDQVFNHSANDFNPLWKLILDHPDELERGDEGGLYFSGASPWGNRMATERAEVQNMLIDVCKAMIVEYHVDGFRFDYTHSSTMDHGFMLRLADEVQALKPDVILIAENMPNESDLNRDGFNGYAQWCDEFHDGIKALLREGEFEGMKNDPHVIGDIFYFNKNGFAAHTNNVVNYCESHDENSLSYEVATNPNLNQPSTKDRKSRLGLFGTMVAVGQSMIYSGQEFAVERERNSVLFPWPANLDELGYFQWASRLIRLRRRYPALKLHGYNPIEEGEFEWIAGPWLDGAHGQGRRMVGWRSKPGGNPFDAMVVIMNFENTPVSIDLELGLPGRWVRLASIEAVNDIVPDGTNHAHDETAIATEDGRVIGFIVPDSSGFIYKWESNL